MQRPLVRLVLAVSLDGRLAPPLGGAAQLGGAGDRRVLEQALAWSDAVLIGAGTLRAHRCTCLIHDPQLLAQRKQDGRPLQPTALVVSRRPDFCLEWPFFQQEIERHLLTPDWLSVDGFSAIHLLKLLHAHNDTQHLQFSFSIMNPEMMYSKVRIDYPQR